MLWFIDVELVNPKTGDKVGKRLDPTVDVSSESVNSWSPEFYRELETAIRCLVERARDVDSKNAKA